MTQSLGMAYNSKQVKVFLGTEPISDLDYATSGAVITIKPSGDIAGLATGINGNSVPYQLNDRSATLEVNLKWGSKSHKILEAASVLLRNPSMAYIDLPITVVDLRSGDEIIATNGIIEKTPDYTYDKEPPNFMWTFKLADGTMSPDTAVAALEFFTS